MTKRKRLTSRLQQKIQIRIFPRHTIKKKEKIIKGVKDAKSQNVQYMVRIEINKIRVKSKKRTI